MNLFTSLCQRTGLVMAFFLTVAITSTTAFNTSYNDNSIEDERVAIRDLDIPKMTADNAATPLTQTTGSDCGCQDQVNVRMNGNCTYTLTLNQVGAGACTEARRLIVNDANPGNGGIIDCPGTYTYGIFDGNDDLICWGEVLAEDKTGPRVDEVETVYETIPCVFAADFVNNVETANPNSPYYIGRVLFEDNCGDCGCSIETKFFDQIEYFTNCENRGIQFGDEFLYARISRKYTSTDCEGNSTDYTVTYDFVRPALDDLILLDDVTEQTCNAAGVTPPAAYPYWEVPFPTADGDYKLGLDEIDCNYSISIDETEFPVCNGSGRKIQRYISVFDWCAGTSDYVDTVVIKIGDFAPPTFKGKAKAMGTGLQKDLNYNQSITSNEVIVDLDSLQTLKGMGMVTTISTRPQDCSGAFSIDLNSLRSTFGFDIEDCSIRQPSVSIMTFGPKIIGGFPTGDSIWREGNYPMINGFAAGIPVGIHALILEVADECYNSAKGVIFFQVKDQIAPVMSCDDQLNITLSTGGYGRVFASDVDEGSSDNCALASLKIRRSVNEACINAGTFDMDDLVQEDGVFYTIWNDYVEFFCCDAGQNVVIELQGTDNAVDPIMKMDMPNRNICWLELLIEDKVDPQCTDLPPAITTCDDEVLNNLDDLSFFGTPQEPFSNCQSFGIEELDPIVDLDRCNVGTITRQWVAVGNGEQSDICEQLITVVARHDYWVRFPADAETTCGDTPSTEGVTFVEDACDLMAVSSEDETFTATQDPNACYKIFRTYRVINWCEYDGEAQPTIVSRDWDGYNGTNPQSPDGDDNPGDEAIYVHVKRDFSDDQPDTVYYDNTDNPYDNSVSFGGSTYGYWWRVISGSDDPTEEAYYEGNGSVWSDDGNQNDSDISGNTQSDDNDYRYGSFGFFQYTQHIVVYDDVDPEITVEGEDTFASLDGENCTGDVTFLVAATDLCTDDTLDVSITVLLDVGNDGITDADVTSNLVNGTFSAEYPQGQHRLVFTANDGCGNAVTVSRVFDVVDRKAPAPICINGISIELMPSEDDTTGGFMEVWASDFIASAIFDCTGQGEPGGDFDLPMITEENYFIVRDEIEGVSEFDPDNPQTGVAFNCNDAGQLIPVEVHTVDLEGNNDYCLTYVQVDDNMDICPDGEGEGLVSGSVKTARNTQVEGVEVSLSGPRDMAYMTDYSGLFRFNNLATGYDYTISPSLNHNARNGVSTADMIMIGRHVLGINPLTDPYQFIAADINNDKSISTLDMLQLRALVLSIRNDFPNNTSWTFVDKAYQFDQRIDPLLQEYPSVRNINDLNGEVNVDFVAVKIGDLNGTANVAETRSLTENPLRLYTDQQTLKAGEEYTVPVYAKNIADVEGFQLSLELNHADLVELIPGTIPEEFFGVFTEQRVVTGSWGRLFAPVTDTEAPLFSLVIRPTNSVPLSQAIRLTSRYTPSEAYSLESLESNDIQLIVGDTEVSGGTIVYQNTPNPFRESTMIGFTLEEAGPVSITFTDMTGKELQVVQKNLDRGYHQIMLNRSDFSSSGVVYYTLRAGEFMQTRKMLLVR